MFSVKKQINTNKYVILIINFLFPDGASIDVAAYNNYGPEKHKRIGKRHASSCLSMIFVQAIKHLTFSCF